MAFFVSQGSSEPRETCPAGPQAAVCTEFKDRGIETDQYGTKHKVEYRFETVLRNGKDFPYVLTRKYPASFGSDDQPTHLRRDLETWRSAAFTAAELKKFDLESMVGQSATLQITHKPGSQGTTFANISAIMPAMPASASVPKPRPNLPIPSKDYDDAVDY